MKPIQDERIIVERRSLILDQPIQQYRDLFALTNFASVYLFIGLVRKGLYQSYRSPAEISRNLSIGALVGTVAFTLSRFIGAIIFLATWIGGQLLAVKISQRRSENDIDGED